MASRQAKVVSSEAVGGFPFVLSLRPGFARVATAQGRTSEWEVAVLSSGAWARTRFSNEGAQSQSANARRERNGCFRAMLIGSPLAKRRSFWRRRTRWTLFEQRDSIVWTLRGRAETAVHLTLREASPILKIQVAGRTLTCLASSESQRAFCDRGALKLRGCGAPDAIETGESFLAS